MLDFIFHRDEKTSAIVEAKYTALMTVIQATNGMSIYDSLELRRLATKFAVMKTIEEKGKK
jgi:hypothetical protein